MGNWISGVLRRLGFQGWTAEGMALHRSSSTDGARKKRALIVVDVQNDFISGSLALKGCPSQHNGEEVVPVINKLVELPFWDLVAYTKDWHPADHVSFVTNAKNFKAHAENKVDLTAAQVFDECVFDVDGVMVKQALWPVHCVQNSEGAELHKDLIVVEGSVTIHKGMNRGIDSYSAFFDNNRRSETILRKVLQDNNISQVYICGLATDVCVNFTCFDAHSLGLETAIIEDACRGVKIEDCEKTIQRMKETGIKVLSSDDIVKLAEE